MSSIINALNWRYATKQFDTTKKLTTEQEATLHEALRLAPSSFGLQPWKFFVVKDAEVRAKLKDAAWGQPQITDSSELVVFAVPTNLTEADVDTYIASVASTRGMEVADLQGYTDMIKGTMAPMDNEARMAWATKQVYIALGVLATAAAVEGIDMCPMEGFDAKQFDAILGLTEKGYAARVIAAVGFRSAEDATAGAAKVRYGADTVIEVI
jgi:nitroreductase